MSPKIFASLELITNRFQIRDLLSWVILAIFSLVAITNSKSATQGDQSDALPGQGADMQVSVGSTQYTDKVACCDRCGSRQQGRRGPTAGQGHSAGHGRADLLCTPLWADHCHADKSAGCCQDPAAGLDLILAPACKDNIEHE